MVFGLNVWSVKMVPCVIRMHNKLEFLTEPFVNFLKSQWSTAALLLMYLSYQSNIIFLCS